MIKSIEINRFKSLQDVNIELGSVNLFIGRNGVGKSNILEAVGLLSACLGPAIDYNALQGKGVRLSTPLLFKSAFKGRHKTNSFSMTARFSENSYYTASLSAGKDSTDLHFLSEKLYLNGNKIFGRSNRGIDTPLCPDINKNNIDINRGLWDQVRAVLNMAADEANDISSLSKYVIYSPQTSFLRGVDTEAFQTKPIGLHGGNLAQAAAWVFTHLKQLREQGEEKFAHHISKLLWATGWANSISVGEHDPKSVPSVVKNNGNILYFKDKFMSLGKNKLSAYDSSEGTLYLLFLISLIAHKDTPKIFAVDNVDFSLNPGLIREIVEYLISICCQDGDINSNLKKQLLFTSHNPATLDAFDIFDDCQRIFVVSRNDDGTSKVTRLKAANGITKDEWIDITKGRNLSEMMLSDKIKGAITV